MKKSKRTRERGAFTLLELIFVMALLAAILAFSAPSLTRSLRERHLEDEAARFLALTEYARNEAISQAIPMVVWVDPETRRFGTAPVPGFTEDVSRNREYALASDIALQVVGGAPGRAEAILFGAEGTPDPTSVTAVRLKDRYNSELEIAQTDDGWGYEIVETTR